MELEKIVDEFDELIKKLEGWYNYYTEESDLVTGTFGKSNEQLFHGIQMNISSMKTDAILLRLGATLLKMEEKAAKIRVAN